MNELEKNETQPEKNGVITLNLNGEKEISILRSVLTEVYPNSALAKHFSMNHRSPWIMKENPGRYYICRLNVRANEIFFKFLTTQSIVVNRKTIMEKLTDELSFYGFLKIEFILGTWHEKDYSITSHSNNTSAKKDEDFSYTFKWSKSHNFM